MGRHGGISLTGILVIGGVLYFTGAGAWLWERVKKLDTGCYALLQEMGTDMGAPICDALAQGLDAIDQGARGAIDQVKDKVGMGGRSFNMEDYAQGLFSRIGGSHNSLASLTSSGNGLSALMDQQPIVLPSIVDSKERLRMALDQFVIGQHYLQGEQTGQAMPWLQRSAEQPGGYGVLSQLTLGDMFRTGSNGVKPDSSAARHYYEGALQSITSLQSSGSNESQQLLGSLPAPPQQLRAQLEAQLQKMK